MRDTDDPLARIPGESRRANQALRDYAAMGVGRSLDALLTQYIDLAMTGHRPLTKVRFTLHEWSRRNHWVARAAAHDADLQRQARLAQIDAVRDMAVRQAEQGKGFQATAKALAERADQYIQLLRVATVETVNEQGDLVRVVKTNLSPQEMAALLRASAALAKVGMDMERLARGEPSEVVDMRVKIRREAERLAEAYGLNADEMLAEAEAILKGGV